MDKELIESHAKFLGEMMESHVREFFSKTLLQQYEQTEKTCDGELYSFADAETILALKNPKVRLGLFVHKCKEELIEMQAKHNEHDSCESDFVRSIGLWSEYNYLFQMLLRTFDEYVLISELLKRADVETLKACGLGTASNRVAALTSLLTEQLNETVKDGGDRHKNWNKWKRIVFLAEYNRFQIVVHDAREFWQTLKNKTQKKMEAEITERFLIPEKFLSDVFSAHTPSEIALRWVKKTFNENQNDKHLRDRVLNQAWKDLEKYSKRKGFTLVFANFANTICANMYLYLPPNARTALKFPFQIHTDFNPKTDNYLVFVED